MILQTGFRTDIPAFYSEWFANRLRAGAAVLFFHGKEALPVLYLP